MQYEAYLEQIKDFEKHYQYDTTYMREMLAASVSMYDKFNNTMPLVSHRELLDVETYMVAKLATMAFEDCGECLQLNIKMVQEQGVSDKVIRGAISGGKGLSAELKDIHDFALMISNNTRDADLVKLVESRLNKGQLLELGLAVATTKIFPVLKRAVGYAKSCSLTPLEI